MKQKTQDLVKDLKAKLDAGIQDLLSEDSWKAFLKAKAVMKQYSFGNTILILQQGGTRVAGYKAWKAAGRTVKRGEKAIRILAPYIRKDAETGETFCGGFGAVSVFDITQTEGEDLPVWEIETRQGDQDSGLLKALEVVAANLNHKIVYKEMETCGFIEKVGKVITIKSTMDRCDKAHTLAHELGHALLHGADSQADLSRSNRELEAESVAFLVCAAFGLDVKGSAFPYLADWKGKEAVEALRGHGERICKAAHEIIKEVEGLIDKPSKKN